MKVITILALLTLFSAAANASVAVIVHPSNANALDDKNISRIFTGKEKSFPDGSKALAINQEEGSPFTDEFNRKVLNKSSSQLKAYWSKLLFTGKGTPPREVSNDTEVMELIAANPNLIGYVDASKVDSSVKVVATF